jgi:hypothetical protein
MARNDDPEYVRSLERALEAAELEIKGLEGELREQDKVLQQLHEQLAPTHMGEPLIQKIRSAQIEAGENAVIANLRGMGLL